MTRKNKKKLIIGNGDLSREFISFSNFELNEYINCDRVEDLNIELPILREYFNEIYIAISDPLIRQKVFNLLKSNNIIVDTYIHPSVIVGKNTVIGEGCIIMPKVLISNDVIIKNSILINNCSNIGHNSIINDFCSIMANVSLGGFCEIEENVYIGSAAVLIPKAKVNRNIKIGLGTVVIRNLKKKGSYFGNPAKFIGEH
tara:strand:+ start:232 stop:831 length:600 start_codon:yes stop_codon:yes gene_type:complete